MNTNKIISRIIKVVMLFLFTKLTYAQQTMRFEHFDQTNGLSQGSVMCIAQYDNYRWFGTQEGLNRYDGYKFEIYKLKGEKAINSNVIFSLFADSQDNFWVGTANGLNLYDKKNNNFKKFKDYLGHDHVLNKNNYITKVIEDKNQNLWILTGKTGLHKLNLKTKKIETFLTDVSNLKSIILDNNGGVWVISTREVLYYSSKKNDFILVDIGALKNKEAIFSSIVFDNNNQLWLASSNNGIFVCNVRDDNERPKISVTKFIIDGPGKYNLSSTGVMSMLKTKNGDVWVGMQKSGISIYNAKYQTFNHSLGSPNKPNTIRDNNIWSIFEDQQGIMWLGTSSKGINKYDPLRFRFNVFQQDFERPTGSIPDNMVFRIIGNKNNIYVGSSSKVSKFDPKFNRFSTAFPLSSNPDESQVNESRTMSIDNNGNFWMVNQGGIYFYDPVSRTQRVFSVLQNSAEYLYLSLFLKEKNEIWIGSNIGFYVFDLASKKLKTKFNERRLAELSRYTIRTVMQDSAKNVWVGTFGKGLYKLGAKSEDFFHFDERQICPNIRSFKIIKNIMWVGTDCGLSKINLKTLKIERTFNENDGLPNNVIYSILNDEKGNLWLGTNNGLSKFSPYFQRAVANYNHQDGIQGDEFNTDCAYLHTDSTMYFGGTNGITYFKPSQIKQNTFVAPVKITKIQVSDSLFNSNSDFLKLNHDQNFINFEFVAFNFTNSEKNTYKYKMEGIDADWIKSGTKNNANYTNLPPGDYVFKVLGYNNDGLKNPKETTLNIEIKPSLTQSWWFKIFAILAIGGLVYLFNNYRNINKNLKQTLAKEEAKRLQNEAEMRSKEAVMQQKIAETEISALRSQMNPHFIFNCLNSIKLYSMENDSKAASDYLTKFSRLIRLVLDNSRSEKITLENEIETLRLYIEMEAMRFKEKVNFRINVIGDIDQQYVEIPPLLIQPYVENAIWHGIMHKDEGGNIIINLLLINEGTLQIEIIDDGIGRTKSAEYKSKSATINKSFGMKMTNERIELINQIYKINTQVAVIDLFDEKGLPAGTKVVVTLPI
jgi:ligand-binding sensor domain-containing protein